MQLFSRHHNMCALNSSCASTISRASDCPGSAIVPTPRDHTHHCPNSTTKKKNHGSNVFESLSASPLLFQLSINKPHCMTLLLFIILTTGSLPILFWTPSSVTWAKEGTDTGSHHWALFPVCPTTVPVSWESSHRQVGEQASFNTSTLLHTEAQYVCWESLV